MFRPLLLACAALVFGAPLAGQFSSDFPGVPRGRASFLSTGQGRFELDLSGYRLRGETVDTIAGSIRMGFGKSWRLGTNMEIGYDLTLGETRFSRAKTIGTSLDAPVDLDATVLYGLRLGAKYQVFNALDPEGYGVAASIGAGIQPELKTVFAYSKRDTVTMTGGYAGDKLEDGGIDSELSAATLWVAAASYRMHRLEADVALIYERASTSVATPVVQGYDGVSLALGGRYRITDGFGLGISFWGSGAPPWRDRLRLGFREKEESNFGILLSFTSLLEKGTDVMISSPTGNFSESVTLYVRAH